MRVNKRQFLLAVRGKGGWINKANGKVIQKCPTDLESCFFINDNNEIEFLEKELINDKDFVRIPGFNPGYIEIAFLRYFQEEFSEIIDRYGLRCYLENEYPMFHADEATDSMIEFGMKAFNQILLMMEENDTILDLYDKADMEIQILNEWIELNRIELSEEEDI